MKKMWLLAASLLLITSVVHAKELDKVKDIAKAAESGKTVKYVMLLDKCKTDDKTWQGNQRLVLETSSYVADDLGIILRGKVFLPVVATYPGMGPVFAAYSAEISPSGKVLFTNYFYDPTTYAEKRQATQVSCQLGDGFKAFS